MNVLGRWCCCVLMHASRAPRGVCALLLAGVAAAQPAPRLDAAGFLPPLPGTTWVYEVHSGGVIRLLTKRITRVLRLDGAPCVEISVQEGTGVGQPVKYEYFALRRDGIVQIGQPSERGGLHEVKEEAFRVLWLTTPAGVVGEWDVGGSPKQRRSPRASLQGIGEEVEVYAGKYACVRVEYSDPDPAIRHLVEYAPGVCVVRDQMFHKGQVVRRVQLRHFRAGEVVHDTPPWAIAAAYAQADTPIVELTHPMLGEQYESRFFHLGTGKRARIVRLFRGKVALFGPEDGPSWEDLLADEGLVSHEFVFGWRLQVAAQRPGPQPIPLQRPLPTSRYLGVARAAALLDALLHEQSARHAIVSVLQQDDEVIDVRTGQSGMVAEVQVGALQRTVRITKRGNGIGSITIRQ